MVISFVAFLGAFPKPNVALHLPEPDDQVNVHNTRIKRGISFSIGLGKEKPKPKVQIVIMKPNFLTDLVMLKKGLLQKVIMTVVGLVGKLTASKQMTPPAKKTAVPMPMADKSTGSVEKQTAEIAPQVSGNTSGRQMGTGTLTINVQTSGNPDTSRGQLATSSISGPMTVNVQTAGNTMPASGSQAALLAAAEQFGQGSTASNGLVVQNSGRQQVNAYTPLQANRYIPSQANAYNYQQDNTYTSQHSPVPIGVGGSWAIASHTPNGQMMMLMPSGSSAHDPVAHAVLTMILNQASNRPRSNRPVFPSDLPVQTSTPPVLAYAVTPTLTRYTPVFNTSWSFPAPRTLQDNSIEKESSTPSSNPSSTIAAILEIASRIFTTTKDVTPDSEITSTIPSTTASNISEIEVLDNNSTAYKES